VLLTFGLIGPGKGIEHVIRALPEIVREHPEVVYLVVGATHPQLVAREGERYRLSLEWLAEELGVKKHVIFYNRFVTAEDLREFIRATDIYLTPYLNEEQITSGTLAQVFGAGKAVIATPYWHARELLTEGRGTLVPFAQPAALAAAVGAYLNDPGLMQRTREAAWQAGRGMIWPAVARRYLECFEAVREEAREPARSAFAGWNAAARTYDLPPPRLDHLVRMFDGTGMLQHALFTVPDFHHGYCTDDNARAYILCCYLDGLGTSSREQCLRGLGTRSLAFLVTALHRETGRFRNFMSFERRWLEVAGSEDSHGRAMWALGTGARQARDPGQRQLSTEWFVHGMSVVEEFTAPRSWAFTLLGLHEFIGANPEHRAAKELREKLMSGLVKLWHHASSPDWPWFEGSVTYDNARLSQALMLSGRSAGNEEAFRIGEESLRWLVSIQTTPAGCFRPVGSGGFYVREGVRAHFDQQPVEAQAMVAACLDAWRLTGGEMWFREARRAFEWFLGRNDLSLPLYDPASGGCADGLHVDRINQNQGAESTLAFHLALAAIVNALWDLYARHAGMPVWKLVSGFTPEQFVASVDFRYLTDALTPQEALELLRRAEPGKAERIARLEREGYPAYTTSAGWLGYPDDKIRRLCREAVAEGWNHIKVKVGRDLQDDIRRLGIIREEIGWDRKLMVDANQVWDVPQAIEWMQSLAPFKPWWIEEPTSPDDVLGHAAIARAMEPLGIGVVTGMGTGKSPEDTCRSEWQIPQASTSRTDW
jgi:hypothetical protein